VVEVRGEFEVDDAVEISDPDGTVFAKGLVRAPTAVAAASAGRRSGDLPEGAPRYLVHADDLVLLP
jgi:glutamate 5-kinase